MLIHLVEKKTRHFRKFNEKLLRTGGGGGGHLLYKYTCGQTKDETLAHNSNQI